MFKHQNPHPLPFQNEEKKKVNEKYKPQNEEKGPEIWKIDKNWKVREKPPIQRGSTLVNNAFGKFWISSKLEHMGHRECVKE